MGNLNSEDKRKRGLIMLIEIQEDLLDLCDLKGDEEGVEWHQGIINKMQEILNDLE